MNSSGDGLDVKYLMRDMYIRISPSGDLGGCIIQLNKSLP